MSSLSRMEQKKFGLQKRNWMESCLLADEVKEVLVDITIDKAVIVVVLSR